MKYVMNNIYNGLFWFALPFLLVVTNDVFAYFSGMLCGRKFIRRPFIALSPNKTWEGFIGGVTTVTIISGLLAPYLTPLTLGQGFVAGMLIAVSGFVGDVVISSVKRDLAIKDSGTLIPGHGGLLDRIDSLIYTAPLFFHFLYYLYY